MFAVERVPKAGNGAAAHAGQWRDASKVQHECSRPFAVEGAVCQHGMTTIERSHWSCCGALTLESPCGCFVPTRVPLVKHDSISNDPEAFLPSAPPAGLETTTAAFSTLSVGPSAAAPLTTFHVGDRVTLASPGAASPGCLHPGEAGSVVFIARAGACPIVVQGPRGDVSLYTASQLAGQDVTGSISGGRTGGASTSASVVARSSTPENEEPCNMPEDGDNNTSHSYNGNAPMEPED
jgi:hypothetical protein